VAGKETLVRANRAKTDEFYTQLADVEQELRRYRDQFRGKVVFCNCDDPYESNFFKYFAMNFNHLGLKKLITTSYTGSPITGEQLSLFDVKGIPADTPDRHAYRVEITEVPDANNDGAIDLSDVEHLLKSERNVLTLLSGNGDFRSAECVRLLKEADIVVTNPPFSLFREYLSQLVKHDKRFLIIGNTNALTYKDTFRLIKDDKLRTGYTNFNVGMFFHVPDDWEKYHHMDDDGRKVVRVSTSCWFTNLEVAKHRERLTFYRKYRAEEYPHYDNYDAIEVGRYTEIPFDFEGSMGVPITFIDKYNPDQFEILGWTRGTNEFEPTAWPTKRYVNPCQIKADGTESNGGKVNTGPTLLLAHRPATGTVYVADNADGYLLQTYMRIIVRNRTPGKAPS
jgi:hypothetical protein